METEKLEKVSFQGINNITYIISTIFVIKLSILSIVKNGFLMKLPLEDVSISELYAAIKIIICIFLMSVFSYTCRRFSSYVGFSFLVIFKISIGYICYYELKHMYFTATWATTSLYFALKLISFCFYDERTVAKQCTINHFLYYLIVPTIIYKPVFKKRKVREYKKLFTLSLKFIISSALLIFSMDQLSVPIMHKMNNTTNIYKLIEIFLTLSVCVIIMFWLFFYLFFCCILEIFAILALFDEKDFYGDWWNSKSVREFWSLWNRMVYLWIRKHIYDPLVKIGFPKKFSGFLCFFVSGVLHEYIIIVSTKTFKGWTFLGFLLQSIFMITTDRFISKHPMCGNIVFWCFFCVVGQPACILLTYR